MPRLVPVPVPAGRRALEVLPLLRTALFDDAGTPQVLLPVADSTTIPELRPNQNDYAAALVEAGPDAATTGGQAVGDLPPDVVLAVGTSGSTGLPKRAALTRTTLHYAAGATHQRLGGPGRWLLALPAHHIAGLMVLIRSLVAGTEPVTVDLEHGFTPPAFVSAVRELGPSEATGRRYTALVPIQLTRLLDSPSACTALRTFDAVLVGGAATSIKLLERARTEGVRVTTTYGMSETCGGCVYDGIPLEEVRLDLHNHEHGSGRIRIGGQVLAAGYLASTSNRGTGGFRTDQDGQRWFVTDDAGRFDDGGRLEILGRLDEVLISGGVKVWPDLVEHELARLLPAGSEVVVVGLPDPHWGQLVAAAVVLPAHTPPIPLPVIRDGLRVHLPAAALPRRVGYLAELPRVGPGKVDRAAVRASLMGE